MDEDDEAIDEELFRWIVDSRLDYLKTLKLLGYKVDDAEINSLDKESHADNPERATSSEPSLTDSDVEDLQREFAVVDFLSQPKNGTDDAIKLLLLRRGPISVRMRADRNHQRPHFHIEYKRLHQASYAIDTLEKLAGDMPAKYEKPILRWAEARRVALNTTWSQLRAGETVTLQREGT